MVSKHPAKQNHINICRFYYYFIYFYSQTQSVIRTKFSIPLFSYIHTYINGLVIFQSISTFVFIYLQSRCEFVSCEHAIQSHSYKLDYIVLFNKRMFFFYFNFWIFLFLFYPFKFQTKNERFTEKKRKTIWVFPGFSSFLYVRISPEECLLWKSNSVHQRVKSHKIKQKIFALFCSIFELYAKKIHKTIYTTFEIEIQIFPKYLNVMKCLYFFWDSNQLISIIIWLRFILLLFHTLCFIAQWNSFWIQISAFSKWNVKTKTKAKIKLIDSNSMADNQAYKFRMQSTLEEVTKSKLACSNL